MRVVFFGTPAFAVPTLERLRARGHDVAAVVTQPDRPQGRSRSQLVPSPVKAAALAAGIPVLQPERPRGDDFLAALATTGAEIGVVAAYGHILKPEVLAVPPRGMVNVHASLLPRLRGAAPIQWAIAGGDAEAGVTIMQMEAGLDSGPTWLERRTPIAEDDTGGTLTARLAALGADALVDALDVIARDGAAPCPQDHARATHAPKIDRDTARIAWDRPAAEVDRHVRAFDPVPGAWAVLEGMDVKLFGSRVEGREPWDAGHASVAVAHGSPLAAPPGTILSAADELLVACGGGAVAIREAQPAGKRRQPVADWVRGRGVAAGQRFG
jgi:methionyl-tRNA formyltransferase